MQARRFHKLYVSEGGICAKGPDIPKAGFLQHDRVFIALDKGGNVTLEIVLDCAVQIHVDVVRVHVGDNVGVNILKDLFRREGESAHGHGNTLLLLVTDPERGQICKAAHAALWCEPGVHKKGLAGIVYLDGRVANLFDAHVSSKRACFFCSP